MRMFKVTADTDFAGLGKLLLGSRLEAGRTEGALRQLKEFNPHLGGKKVLAGTIVLVPDHPDFKGTSDTSTPGSVFEDFAALATEGLKRATRDFKSAGAQRAAERSETLKALQSVAVKRAAERDSEIAGQVEEAFNELKNDEGEEKDAQGSFAAMRDAAVLTLAEMGKRFT